MLEARKALHTEYANSLETNASFTSSTSLGTPKSPKKKAPYPNFDDAIDSPLGSRHFSHDDSTAERAAVDLRPLEQFRILAGNVPLSSERNLILIGHYTTKCLA